MAGTVSCNHKTTAFASVAIIMSKFWSTASVDAFTLSTMTSRNCFRPVGLAFLFHFEKQSRASPHAAAGSSSLRKQMVTFSTSLCARLSSTTNRVADDNRAFHQSCVIMDSNVPFAWSVAKDACSHVPTCAFE